MNVLVATEYRITKYNNRYYVNNDLYSIVKRYWAAFENVSYYTRVEEKAPTKNQLDITDFVKELYTTELVDEISYKSYQKLKRIVREQDLVIGRFDSIVACRAASCAKQEGKPFYAELMADAWDGYWNHGIIGKILAPYMFIETRRAVRKANYALYVTNAHLQKRYPCKCSSISASNVNIDEPCNDILNKRIEHIRNRDYKELRLLTLGGVDVYAKGQQFVIKAIPLLNKHGIRVKYYLAGTGDQTTLKKLTKSLNVEDQVCFLGGLSHDMVLETLDYIDIYIQPSLQEGLPRSVIEAMSRGCPCLGSRTAGTPELIQPEYIFKRKSPVAITNAIISIFNTEIMLEQASRNFNEARKYSNNILEEKRNTYFNMIKDDILNIQ